jgi:DNA ligase (NAD+)
MEKKFHQLDRAIAHHDHLYYGESAPEISDWDYDQLKKERQALLTQFPFLQVETQTKAVGDDRRQGFRKVTHAIPMLSLANTYNQEELRAFIKRIREGVSTPVSFVVEPKIDGVALSIMFKNGHLCQGVTRGDGHEGDDVSRITDVIEVLPKQLCGNDIPKELEVRGEVYITGEDFQKINEKRQEDGLDVFANARNLAAGSLKLLDPHLAKNRCLRFIAYEIGLCSHEFKTHEDVLSSLAQWGLPVNSHWMAYDFESIWAVICRYDEERKTYAMGTDGAVIKINERNIRKQLGSIASSPRWAIAYKYTPERVKTRLLSIELSVGRTGIVAPVAHLEPVLLAGSTIRHATLHNGDEIARKDVRVGDWVILEKAGEVIPAIVAVDFDARPIDSKPFTYPSLCPACGETLRRLEGEVAYRCLNFECPPQISRRLEHFVSKKALDIEALGPQRIHQLREIGLVHHLSDIFRLTKEAFLRLPHVQEKSATAFMEAIENGKKRPFWRLLHGLGIPHVGMQMAKLLATRWQSMNNLAKASLEELAAHRGIGHVIAFSIRSFFQSDANRHLIDDLATLGVSMEDEKLPTQTEHETNVSFFHGKSFVITGTFHAFTREELREEIERRGGIVKDNISRKTNGLIVGEQPGNKKGDAQTLGIPLIYEEELNQLLGL